MLVFWKARLVFLAVPKTGTSAWENALLPFASMTVLDPPELKHAPVYRYNRFFRPMYDKMGAPDMELLAVVREPISWLGSWYRYRQRGFLEGKPTSTRGMTFDAFCQAYSTGERPPFANVGSQAKFIEPRPNGISVSHLFKYENQAGLIDFMQDRLGIAIDLPRENVSPRRDLSLSDETEAKLRRKCAADFEAWERAL
ncbi:sulfotransferase family 2 domain-containing protein [Pacificoceanicola onchidii]|uniref:sulfotransferase family 2 domain-containing protein n=1 Tax=Pacificoceanicola onchidii TaxID=2562685 RepID=UPI0010A4C618|nr:sulfotransferase family 2 domain-containing protein [Pacificoceanicola onchidii]